MTIIPVLDLLNGVAVQAVGGIRNEYQPLQSADCLTSRPEEILLSIQERYGLSDWYLADLDGIVHRRWNFELLRELASGDFQFRIDCGICDVEDYFTVLPALENARCILASEALRDSSVLDSLTCMQDPAQFLFSLDLIEGRLNAPPQAWSSQCLLDIAKQVVDRGIQELIVLDLAYVGCERGLGTLKHCREIRAALPDIRLITGGGVRTLKQIQQLEEAGVDAVLLGSCLHHGQLTREEIQCYCSTSLLTTTGSKTRGCSE